MWPNNLVVSPNIYAIALTKSWGEFTSLTSSMVLCKKYCGNITGMLQKYKEAHIMTDAATHDLTNN